MDTPLPGAPAPVVVPQNQPQQRSRGWVLWLVGALVLVGVAAGAYWWYVQPEPVGPEATATPQSVAGHVRWQVWERVTDGADFLPHFDPCKPRECEENYLIGSFESGPYAGSTLFAVYSTEGMGGGYPYYFVRTSGGATVLLEHDSEAYYQQEGEQVPFTFDREYAIPELQAPSVLTSPDGKLILERQPNAFFGPPHRWDQLTSSSIQLVEVFSDPVWGPVYTEEVQVTPTPTLDVGRYTPPGYNGFYLRLPSGVTVVYNLRIDFIDDDGTAYRSVRWNPGLNPAGEYVYTDVGGCGARNIISVMQPYELDATAELEEIGRTHSSGPVMGFKDSNHAFLRNLYDVQYTGTWIESESRFGNKMPYDQFIKSVPVFFWRDPLGRLIKFENKQFLPQVECGKPVIYLYPGQTSTVSVVVEPQGGMTFSEPAYNDGWTVTAQPDGRLTDSSGAPWPYLFWEGRGGLYEQPEKGWVVARAEADAFLSDKLSALGLVANEIADFKEFWLPRMQDAPYYFVSFLGNRAMDELAPLTVSPAPDTVIRVLMDFSPLAEPKVVEPYSIRTPVRTGFTVVEWGGVIR